MQLGTQLSQVGVRSEVAHATLLWLVQLKGFTSAAALLASLRPIASGQTNVIDLLVCTLLVAKLQLR